jgi:uncharacterized protein (TIGR02466 family)
MTKTKKPSMVHKLFETPLYQDTIGPDKDLLSIKKALKEACLDIASEDKAGQAWSKQKDYLGYTSYASLTDLEYRHPSFTELKPRLDSHARAAAKAFYLDIVPRSLKLSGLWINILKPHGHHSNHIHPHSVLSGTIYVDMPIGAAQIKFEDPRLDRFMNAPLKVADAPFEFQTHFTPKISAGDVLIWESWLRHEVPINLSREDRISISFNYNCR